MTILGTPLAASAQEPRTEVTGFIAYGARQTEDLGSGEYASFGGSLGYLVSPRIVLMGEYSHLRPGPTSIHFFSGSVLVQAKSQRVKPFFQVGFGAGFESRDQPVFPSATRSGTQQYAGIVYGVGAAARLTEKAFLRPHVRGLVTGPFFLVCKPPFRWGGNFS